MAGDQRISARCVVVVFKVTNEFVDFKVECAADCPDGEQAGLGNPA